MIDIKVISEKKGSNPGGKCILPYRGSTLEAYLKYCQNSRLPFGSPFTPSNQPIYEAVTLVLAEQLGLQVPRYFVLMNPEKKEIKFYYNHRPKSKDMLSETMPCYFISKLAKLPKIELGRGEEIQKKMREEKIYRDLIMITDLSNKQQNYAYMHEGSNPHLLYIDLGCSFVNAVENVLFQSYKLKNLLGKKGEKGFLKKDLKNAKEFLRRYAIITGHKEEYKKDIIEILDLAESVPNLPIPLFPKGNVNASFLLGCDELEEIVNLLILNMEGVVRKAIDENNSALVKLT